jgi:DNA-binding NtrC family response regulator
MGQSQQFGARVLIVEDDPVGRSLVSAALRRRGFEILHANDAAEAIAILKEETVQAVFTDVIMPGEIDGFGLQEWARINRPGLPVIVGSADERRARPTFLEEFRFFAKPYNMDIVAGCIRLLIDRRAANKTRDDGSLEDAG